MYRITGTTNWWFKSAWFTQISRHLLTILFGCFIVLLAHEPPILHEVELITGGQLPAAHYTSEAVKVVHKVLSFPDHLRRGNPLLARCTFCPKTPAGTNIDTSVWYRFKFRYNALITSKSSHKDMIPIFCWVGLQLFVQWFSHNEDIILCLICIPRLQLWPITEEKANMTQMLGFSLHTNSDRQWQILWTNAYL